MEGGGREQRKDGVEGMNGNDCASGLQYLSSKSAASLLFGMRLQGTHWGVKMDSKLRYDVDARGDQARSTVASTKPVTDCGGVSLDQLPISFAMSRCGLYA